MAFWDPTVITSLVVGALAAYMAWMTFRSYRATGNDKLLFVLVAFIAFLLKSLVIAVNELAVPHFFDEHTSLTLSGIMDVMIVLLLFIPFVAPRRR